MLEPRRAHATRAMTPPFRVEFPSLFRVLACMWGFAHSPDNPVLPRIVRLVVLLRSTSPLHPSREGRLEPGTSEDPGSGRQIPLPLGHNGNMSLESGLGALIWVGSPLKLKSYGGLQLLGNPRTGPFKRNFPRPTREVLYLTSESLLNTCNEYISFEKLPRGA